MAVALLVCAGYYVGANIGFILRLPPTTPSVMWPPNALLTTTLLLAPPRRWWLYLLAAFPAHLGAELAMPWPPSLVLAFFITNCSEALLAAVGMRWVRAVPVRFDTLRRVVMFSVVTVLLAPLLSSFADAAAVTALQGESYWLVWRIRLCSNVLTELTLVPALVLGITAGPTWLRGTSRLRHAEAVLLIGGLCTVGIVVFAGPIKGLDAIPTRHARCCFVCSRSSSGLQSVSDLWARVCRFWPLQLSLCGQPRRGMGHSLDCRQPRVL
jgi:integral membrane sensor domain MASE1